nr:putative serine/threonine-protein kinase [Ipomoea batatas]
MGCFSFLFHKKIPSPTTHLSDHEEDLYGLRNVSIFSYKDLRVATDDFSPTSKIGEGGFGCVYKVWRLYESQELVLLVDTTMDGAFDAEQACKFLQIGLLCTQDAPKLRPSMSRVVKMLTGEMEVNKDTITKPGLITDFMDLKIKNPPKTRPENIKAAYDYILSSESDHSSLPSGTSSQVTTFTTIPNDQSTYLSTNPLQ